MAEVKELVLVTGGSGFIGSHTVLAAVQAGYRVRTTVRSLERAGDVRQMLINGGASQAQADAVGFVAADLLSDQGWTEACQGCTYVHHVASPFPEALPKDENELIIPARDGTLRVLKAAKAAGVKRLVLTSSIAAVAYGQPPRTELFSDQDWTLLDTNRHVPTYQKSKTIAERAAWDFVEKEGAGLELATILPAGVLGPVLSKSAGTSVGIVIQMLSGQIPALPKLKAGWVDVRDVAQLHMKAMLDPQANGQRFLASTEEAYLKQLAEILKAKLGSKASKVTTREVPNIVLKFVGLFDKRVALIVDELDFPKAIDSTKTKTMLKWQPIPLEDAVISSGESVIKYGLV